MKWYVTLLVVLVLPNFLFPQDGKILGQEIAGWHTYELNIMPLSVFDVIKPHLRLGFEYDTKKAGILTELELGDDNLISKQWKDYGMAGFRVQPRFLYPTRQGNLNYVGLEFFANTAQYVYDGGFNIQSYEVRADEIHKVKTKYGVDVILGKKIFVSDRWSLDIYIGSGYAWKRLSFPLYTAARAYFSPGQNLTYLPGRYRGVNFVCGFRLNWLLIAVERELSD